METQDFWFYIGLAIIGLVVLSKTGVINPKPISNLSNNQSAILERECNVCQPPVVERAEPYFCPVDDCVRNILTVILNANTSIYMSVNEFKNVEIMEALKRARNKDLDIRVLFDVSHATDVGSVDEQLQKGRIQVRYGSTPYVMDNMYIIADNKIVVTGSGSLTDASFVNNENNIVVITSSYVAEKYRVDFFSKWDSALFRRPTV